MSHRTRRSDISLVFLVRGLQVKLKEWNKISLKNRMLKVVNIQIKQLQHFIL